MQNRKYIGDGVYASTDTIQQIWLDTQRDHGTERVALEPATMKRLIDYAREVWPREVLVAIGIRVREESKDGSTEASG